MGTCEICGKAGQLVKAKVSGSELEVCEACSRFGRVLARKEQRVSTQRIGSANTLYKKPIELSVEPQLRIVEDYALKIRHAREKMKLSHEDLSKKVAEKESMLHHIESGHHEPSIAVARKLEKFFSIRLVEELDEKKDAAAGLLKKKASEGMTLGDFIKIKKR